MTVEWHIRFEGRVQGVGFRSAVCKQAEIHRIQGYVRNCVDGSVETVAQGAEASLEAFIQGIRARPGIGAVNQIKIDRRRPARLFTEFEIR